MGVHIKITGMQDSNSQGRQNKKTQNKSVQTAFLLFTKFGQGNQRGRETLFRLIAINFSQKSPHFSLLSPTSPCELSEREVTSPSNLKVVGALWSYGSWIYN